MSEKKPKCAAQGCDKKTHAKGYCKSHYKTYVGEVNKRAKASEAARLAKQTEQSKAAPQLTKEQLEKVFMTPCKTKDDLKNFIKFFFNIYLPDQIVSRYADSSPMDALWEMYQITALNHNPENVQELIYVASRGSGKTLSVSLAQLFAVIHGQRDVVHVGAIQAQAKRAYDYINGYLMRDRVKGIVDPPKTPDGQKILIKNTMERSSFKVDGEVCTIEIIPCTIKSCLAVGSRIGTPNGAINVELLKVGDTVLSTNGHVQVVSNDVIDAECLEIELEDGSIIQGTLDHRVWTQRGWVCLSNLTNKDDILKFNGKVK